MFATVVPPSASLLVRGGLRSVAAGRVLVRGEHSRDVHDAQGPSEAQSERPPRRGRYLGDLYHLCAQEVSFQNNTLRGARRRRRTLPAAAPQPREASNKCHHGSGQTRRCVRVILRAARSDRALDSPPTCPRSRSSRSAIAGGGSSSTSEGEGCPRAPAGGRSPGSFTLASARAQGGALRLVPACIRFRQHSTTVP
jgi:hypothetical protein